MRNLSRRTFLLTTAGTVFLAACGSDGGEEVSPGDGTDGEVPEGGVLAFRQDPSVIVATVPQRMVFALSNADGSSTRGGPSAITFDVAEYEGDTFTSLPAPLHVVDGQEYYAFDVTLPAPGEYQVTVAGTDLTAGFTAQAPEDVLVPRVGDQLVRVDTPTTRDGRGVDPICTRVPACPFHEVNLTDSLDAGRPVVLLIGTPAYCQTAVCGPVLEELMTAIEDYGDQFDVIHAEIYTAPYTSSEQPPTTATVQAFNLSFEPLIYVAGADGVIRQRLDAIWDGGELTTALDAALAPA